MANNKITFRDILEASKTPDNISYEIEGKKLIYKFKDSRYSFFSKKRNSKVESKENHDFFKKSLSAILTCIPIKTLNPCDVWFEVIINEKLNLVQILSADTFSRNLQTKKLLKNYLINFDHIEYGKTNFFKRFAEFSGFEELKSFLKEEILDKEAIFKSSEDDFLRSLKKIYFFTGYKEKIKVSNIPVRKIKIFTLEGEFGLFKGF